MNPTEDAIVAHLPSTERGPLAAHTFPLWPVVDGACGCSDEACARAGKHPRCAWTSWTKGHKDGEGYGIRTGMGSGIFVVDCDSLDAVEAFMAEYPEASTTYTVETAKGAHFYFLAPTYAIKTGKDVLGPGIDVRGDGGFVVGPGSSHKTGAIYAVALDVPIGEASAGLKLACMRDREDDTASEVARAIGPDHKYWSERISRWEKDVATWPEDGSVNLLNLAQTGARTYELPDEIVLAGLERYNARCTPSWTDTEIDHKLTDARTIGTFQLGAGEGVRDALAAAQERNRAKLDETRAEIAESFDKPQRRRHNPAHRYSYFVGQTRANEAPVKVPRNQLNQMLAQGDDWRGVFQFNEFSQQIEAVDPPVKLDAERDVYSDADDSRIAAWIEDNGGLVTEDNVRKAVVVTAEQNAYHPVREYLASLPPEGCHGLLDDLAARLFGAELAIENDFLKKFLISAVRRIQHPGCKVDTMLILKGAQGALKSSFVEVLFGSKRVTELTLDMKDKDAAIGLQGSWAVEIGELDSLMRANPDTAKAWLARRKDYLRCSYARSFRNYHRQCVFVGTTNRGEFLRDETGNRRFLPIEVTVDRLDIAFVEEHRDQIWAEAQRLANAGAVWNAEERKLVSCEHKHWYEDESASDLKGARDRFAREPVLTNLVREFLRTRDSFQNIDEVYEVIFAETRQWTDRDGKVHDTTQAPSPKDLHRQRDHITEALRFLGWDNNTVQRKRYWHPQTEEAKREVDARAKVRVEAQERTAAQKTADVAAKKEQATREQAAREADDERRRKEWQEANPGVDHAQWWRDRHAREEQAREDLAQTAQVASAAAKKAEEEAFWALEDQIGRQAAKTA